MDILKNIYETLKNVPKATKVVIFAFFGVAIVIIIIAIIAINASIIESTALVDVTNFGEVSNAPEGYQKVIERNLGEIIKGNEGMSGLVFSNAAIREGTYNEVTSGGIVTANFIVDIEELEYSFQVKAVWPVGTSNNQKITDPDVTITCPYYTDVIYKNKKCIVGSPEQQIERYLPHYEKLDEGKKFGVSLQKYDDEYYLAVETKSCGDKTVEQNAIGATKKWIKSIYMDPNDFNIQFFDICNKGN